MVESKVNVLSNENDLKKVFKRNDKDNYYDDDDLKTPEHDKIMDYLIDDNMLSKIANTLNFGFVDQYNKTRKLSFDEKDSWKKIEELPIKIGYNFRYIDLYAAINKVFTYSNDSICNFLNYNGKCLVPDDRKDCLHTENVKECNICEPKKYEEVKELKMCIEVKTTIPSIGGLIRQINTYRNLNSGIYIVITSNVNKTLLNRLNNANIYLMNTTELGIVI